jgi:Ca2+-binding RTX toxin-like protein
VRAPVTARYLTLCLLAACAPEEDGEAPHSPGEYDGVEEATEALTDLTAQCTFPAAPGLMTLTLESGDIALFARAPDSRILLNGHPCGGATVTQVKRIEVSEATAGDQTLIADYSGGLFATGTSTGSGLHVDLGSETTADALKIIGSSGVDNVVFGASGVAVDADGRVDITFAGVEQFVASLGDANDSGSGAGNVAAGAAFAADLELHGGAGHDTLRGGAGDDLLFGGEGNDTFPAGAAADGGDVMSGGNGGDLADYGARPDPVTVSLDGVANDGASAGAEADDVQSDVEAIKGGAGNDSLTGGAGAETLSGGAGNDTLTGGPGADTLNGDAGDDVFAEESAATGADLMNGGAGVDTANYGARSMPVTVVLDTIASDGQSGESDRVAIDVENVTGGSGNDNLTGSAAANLIAGGGGDDTLIGGAGDDTLRGGAGNDSLDGGVGNDVLDAEAAAAGADLMAGGTGIDLVTYAGRSSAVTIAMDGITPGGETGEGDRVATDVENLRAGAGNDQITGNALDNVLEGGSGTDTIGGGAGDDTIDGDAGSDAIDCGSGDGDVLLDSTTSMASSCEL